MTRSREALTSAPVEARSRVPAQSRAMSNVFNVQNAVKQLIWTRVTFSGLAKGRKKPRPATGAAARAGFSHWPESKAAIHTASATRSQSNCCSQACRWNAFRCSRVTRASRSRRSITPRGYERGKSNWRPTWNGVGRAIRLCSPRRRVHQRYTGKGMSLTD